MLRLFFIPFVDFGYLSVVISPSMILTDLNYTIFVGGFALWFVIPLVSPNIFSFFAWDSFCTNIQYFFSPTDTINPLSIFILYPHLTIAGLG